MMELYIETLTGTAFELRVSPFETIMSVKAKIQRLEGIPIGQQHLIWQTVELEDEYCLHDYDIHSGATLKLVLAMRGGPINTRRVPIEDSSLVEYMESTPDELLEKLPGSRQVTLLVYREGDQLNFFRVVDRGDGTLTPLSESLSAASMYNMYDEEDDAEGPNKEKLEENRRTREKLSLLKDKMDNMSISKKTKKIPSPPAGRPKSSNRLTIRNAHQKPSSALNKNRCLPPVVTKSTLVCDHDYSSNGASIPKPPAITRTLSHDLSQRLHQVTTAALPSALASSTKSEINSAGSKAAVSSRSMRHRASSDVDSKLLVGNDSIIKTIPENDPPPEDSARPYTSSKRKEPLTLDRLKESLRGATSGVPEATQLPYHRSSSRQHEGRSSSRQHDVTLGTQRIALESLSSSEAKAMSGLLQQASLECLGSSNINNFSPVRARRPPGYVPLPIDEALLDTADRRTMSATRPIAVDVRDTITSSSAKLPPVKAKKKTGKSARCFVCCKKTGLATSYPCRCGNNFCASHRYAEAHACTFDYKTEGRKLLEQSNPVISAPKLPKI